MDSWEKLEEIGQGAYGTVYKARSLEDGTIAALKRVQLAGDHEGVQATTLREVSTLRELTHPCVVELMDIQYEHSAQCIYMVFEFMEQDLKRYLDNMLRNGRRLSSQLIKSYLFQLVAALDFCHQNRIMHRDLKPHNILIDKKGSLKLADFGLARAFTMGRPRKYTHEVVTLWYRPPEVLLGDDGYLTAVDVWSIGCIFAEMATLRPLFPGDSEIDQIFRIFRIMGTPHDSEWPGVQSLPHYHDPFPNWPPLALANVVPGLEEEGVKLLERMLVYNPHNRISCDTAMYHAYFEDISPLLLQLRDDR
ncbi:unnamed protein product [Chrysoparadoxa australica]